MGYARITPEEIKEFFQLYEKYGTFKKVAELTGRSPQSVAKYVKQDGSFKALKQAARQTITK